MTKRARTTRFPAGFLAGLLWTVVAGCDFTIGTQPLRPDIVERALADVVFGAARTTDGYLDFSAYLPAGHVFLLPHERVLIQLSTSGGDSEEIAIGPGVCTTGNAPAICREYVAMLDEPAQFDGLANIVDAFGARMNRIGTETSRFAVVYVFADGEALVRQQISALAGISSIEPNHLASLGIIPQVAPPQLLHAAMRVNASSTRTQRDGVLTVQVGDLITVTFPGVGGTPQTVTRTVVE